MAKVTSTLKTNGFAALGAITQNGAPVAPVAEARFTAPNSVEANQGVSMADMIRTMLQAELAKLTAPVVSAPAVETPVMQAFAPVAPAKTRKGTKVTTAPAVHVAHTPTPSNARVATAPTTAKGPWYMEAFKRADKKTGNPFYSIDFASIMVVGNVAVAKSNKWAPAVMLIEGRRKPIYLKPAALDALIQSRDMLLHFAKVNAEYLAQSLLEGDSEE